MILPVAMSLKMLIPIAPHLRGVDEAAVAKAAFAQQSFGPLAQRPAQPFAERNAETHLRSFDQRGRNVAIKHLPQDPFADAIAHHDIARQPRGELYDPMIYQGHPR